MQCSRGVAAACVSIVILSTLLLYLAYSIVEGQVFGIDSSEDTFFVIESGLFTCVAVWGIATVIGIWRLRRWDAHLLSGLVVPSFWCISRASPGTRMA